MENNNDSIKKRARKVVDAGSVTLAHLQESIVTNEKLDELLAKEVEFPEPQELPEYPSEMAISNLPDVQKVEVTNFPKQEAPVVNVEAPVVNVNVPNVYVPEIKLPVFNVPTSKVEILTDKLTKALTDLKEGLDELNLETKKPKPSSYPSGVIASSVRVKNLLDQQINPATSDNQTNNKQLVRIGDGVNLDSFGRFRTSRGHSLFEAQLTYDLQPLVWEQSTNGSGASVTHDSTNRCALMTFSSTPTGGKALMQTYSHFRYTAGKSQVCFITFNMNGGVANTKKFAGYSNGTNGIEFQLDGATPQFVILSGTTNGNESATQSQWNVDKLDGTGDSGITIDFTKTQIMYLDFQALYVGRVRVGFDIGGQVVVAHEFNHANVSTYPYLQSANLPLRVGMTSTGTVSTTMNFICSTVQTEDGEQEAEGYHFSAEGTATAADGARTHLLSVQPRLTFNSIENRAKFILEGISILNSGNTDVKWELCVGDVLTGTTTFNDVNTTYSAFAYNTLGTTSGTPLIVMETGYVPATNQSNGAVETKVPFKYPITLDMSGAVRPLGRLTLLVIGLGATSACRGSLNWKEIR